MKKILFKCAILAAGFMISVGCTNPSASAVNGNAKSKTSSSSNENGGNSITEKENEKTIETFLKVEITGPNNEFKKAFGPLWSTDSNSGPNFILMKAYDKKYYEPLLSKNYYKEFINDRYEVYWLQASYKEGYQFKVKNIKIKKEKDDYSWTADVDRTKDGKTKTSMINGLISLNENGKISYVRFIDGNNGIMKIVHDAN